MTSLRSPLTRRSRDPATRRSWVGSRCVQNPPRPKPVRAPSTDRAPDRASPLGTFAGLSTIDGAVDSVGQMPFFVRSRGFPKCRSIPFFRDSHGAGFDATLHAHGVNDKPDSLASGSADSAPEGAHSVEPSTAEVRGHLPWGPRPSDEINQGDRCAGLPHQHHPLSGFLTLSAV